MGPVDVSVGHQDDLAVAQLCRIEVVLADASAEGRDHGADFFMAQHLVVASLLHVKNLSLERQNRLEAAITALLRGSTCRFTLNEIQFATLRLALAAVGQFAR